MKTIPYTTTGGENWGMIAYKHYGDESLIDPIIEANPTVAVPPIIPAGIVLLVPIPEQTTTVVSDIPAALLPPWKK